MSQSERFSRLELILLGRTFAPVLEAKIWVSSAYKQGVVILSNFVSHLCK